MQKYFAIVRIAQEICSIYLGEFPNIGLAVDHAEYLDCTVFEVMPKDDLEKFVNQTKDVLTN